MKKQLLGLLLIAATNMISAHEMPEVITTEALVKCFNARHANGEDINTIKQSLILQVTEQVTNETEKSALIAFLESLEAGI